MTHVMDIQLALDVEIKGIVRHHVRDLGNFTLESCLVNRQEAIGFHADTHGLAVLHLLGLNRHHAADGSFYQTHGLVKLSAFLSGQLLFQHALQHLVGIHQVLTDDDIQRATVHCPALTQTGNDIGNDELQDTGAHSGGHDVATRDGIGSSFGVVAVNSGDILNPHILMTLTGNIANGIGMVFLQGLNNRLCHINKGDFKTGLAQQRTDEAAADIAAAVHNCFFHYLPPQVWLYSL